MKVAGACVNYNTPAAGWTREVGVPGTYVYIHGKDVVWIHIDPWYESIDMDPWVQCSMGHIM